MVNRLLILTLPAVLMLMGASACQSSTPSTTNPQETPATPAPLRPCGSGAPHIDRDKIRQRLLEKGVLTPQMSEQQQQQILNDYIRQRQQAYSKCQKEPKA
ncbi:hypothetical protein [Shewanella dokdonensis]|uniref:Lipoprotein n=1 Tax=Shewanella dokdonensis TaxID=712036 RepID=A0ABX8DIM2_9GAMM|nr:hypothetical protein [Shewanella dokdonensis]MCL1075628.1 hypothetical protein [Shewanella dokdonensis]QVK24629.1 hypothetical protein KHX94_09540 [Shewanella dokdonensis]